VRSLTGGGLLRPSPDPIGTITEPTLGHCTSTSMCLGWLVRGVWLPVACCKSNHREKPKAAGEYSGTRLPVRTLGHASDGSPRIYLEFCQIVGRRPRKSPGRCQLRRVFSIARRPFTEISTKSWYVAKPFVKLLKSMGGVNSPFGLAFRRRPALRLMPECFGCRRRLTGFQGAANNV
jgi:hypothetical protein